MSRGRVYTDGGNVYRVRLEQTSSGYVRFLGPYSTLGAARGQASQWRGPDRKVTVEFAPATAWQEVPA